MVLGSVEYKLGFIWEERAVHGGSSRFRILSLRIGLVNFCCVPTALLHTLCSDSSVRCALQNNPLIRINIQQWRVAEQARSICCAEDYNV